LTEALQGGGAAVQEQVHSLGVGYGFGRGRGYVDGVEHVGGRAVEERGQGVIVSAPHDYVGAVLANGAEGIVDAVVAERFDEAETQAAYDIPRKRGTGTPHRGRAYRRNQSGGARFKLLHAQPQHIVSR
jgi:hypothetical protein